MVKWANFAKKYRFKYSLEINDQNNNSIYFDMECFIDLIKDIWNTHKFNLIWTFITPNAPHHGGLYEAAVKSAKYHLKRVIGETTLTFEEYATILSQVEACLNKKEVLKRRKYVCLTYGLRQYRLNGFIFRIE